MAKKLRRQSLLETLEARQLLAGPQLIGIQPNEGDLIVEGSIRNNAPSVLTFRFDENQQIDPDTLGGIQITRSGPDDLFFTDDDVQITPGLVTIGDPNENEVIVRFAESLPDDNYRIEVFGYDDAQRGITGIRNLDGELLQPRTSGARSEVINFDLRLGALVESVVPQPVIRVREQLGDGTFQETLKQNRNEIVVYFNEDELFVENDAAGNPTDRSAENPRFYQLLLTQDTARTTDDLLFYPEKVVYDAATYTARLFFEDDINNLPNVPASGGTFRLRVGSAVDDRLDLIIQPTRVSISAGDTGETLDTAYDVGTIGIGPIFNEVYVAAIEPTSFDINLPGGNDDPGHREFDDDSDSILEHINANFGADATDGITEISYNFNDIFDTNAAGASFLNQIREVHKSRIREALSLWSAKIGVQFRETQDQGITFAIGNRNNLQPVAGTEIYSQSAISATVRIDPTFADSAIVLTDQTDTAYGEGFFRNVAAGIGLLLGLETTPDLPAQTLMSLSSSFLNASINTLGDLEPVFPGNFDVLHGQYLYNPDSVDLDLYRFVIDLDDANKVGTLTAETFAERLADSSMLDTTLTLFQEIKASLNTNFGVAGDLNVRFDSLLNGRIGDHSKINFVESDRAAGDTAVIVRRALDSEGVVLDNTVTLDLPRGSAVSAQAVIDAINGDAFASSIIQASLISGDGSTDISGNIVNFSTLELSGGGLFQLSRNDDYFSEDSMLSASLGEGTYYIGVAASGNDHYDPTIAGSSIGGLSQGNYELNLKFEPKVDERDVIRDLDSDREGVPGSILDGDADGEQGGNHNFWFQTRPINRRLEFIDSGSQIVPGQTVRIIGTTPGSSRTYEYVLNGSTAELGNIPIFYSDGSTAPETPATQLANALSEAINLRSAETGVTVTRLNSNTIEILGEQQVTMSDDAIGINITGRNIFVDKSSEVRADGSLAKPFNNIANPDVPNAFAAAQPGDIVRIIGNGGLDGDMSTEADNLSYQIGIPDVGGGTYADGRAMEVPKGVTTMIDAGAAFKLRSSYISVGSSTIQVDRSNGVLQVLGTPRLINLTETNNLVPDEREVPTLLADENAGLTGYDDGSVIFTSFNDKAVDAAAASSTPTANAGDWGGIRLRNDIDLAEGRRGLEDEAIFLDRINHAEIRYGGSRNVMIDSVSQLANPIDIYDRRPTISFTEISHSADAAISALPDSFKETSYQSPEYQASGIFTPDYDRVGPDIHNNQLFNNSINGLFIRVATTSNESPKELTVAGRFDDTDIVHYVAENIIIQGTPGGSIQDGFAPSVTLVSAAELRNGTLNAGTYNYRMTFVDENGFESLASPTEFSFNVTTSGSAVKLFGLPQVPNDSDYLTRRLYRQDSPTGPFYLITNLDATGDSFLDQGTRTDGVLDTTRTGIRGRLDASLVVDPGMVIKMRSARIEVGHGAQLLAEGTSAEPIVFTSVFDDRFGAGGTFDSNNDADVLGGSTDADYGDWGGIYGSPTSTISLDYSTVAYGGGITLMPGGETGSFLALELHQANGRITNSQFEYNDSGQDGSAPAGRFGRLAINPATIFVRGAQPIIVGTTFTDNHGAIIDIDSESFTAERLIDAGRQTGSNERLSVLDDNFGPMVRFNRYVDTVGEASVGLRQISGMEIRGGTLTTESVWDDTDIVHVLLDSIEVENFHSSGGLRLMSRVDESLVVKLFGEGSETGDTEGTGFTATGSPSNISDRIGGTIHILGQPGAPVILTSFLDDTVGAGLQPDGTPFTDTNGDALRSRAEPNDWRSVLLDQFSNDRNVSTTLEYELNTELAPGINGELETAQLLGELAADTNTANDVYRLGFEVEGYLAGQGDIDTYSFFGSPGTEIWIDIDQTSYHLDTVIELLDESGNIIDRSDDGFALSAGNIDFESQNPRDAGIRYILPGSTADANARSVYFFRVRSASVDPDDANGGLTSGGYSVQLRLQEEQEFPGSVVRYTDIRYANHGIHTQGLPSSSPLLGEAQENEQISFASSNDSLEFDDENPGQRPQYLGDLLNSNNKVFSVGGELSSGFDVDFYQFDVNPTVGGVQQTSVVFDLDYSQTDTSMYVFYDPDGFDEGVAPRLILASESSNIVDDQANVVTTALGSSDPSDVLSRGSDTSDDPFIGPISLDAGSYFVALVADGRVAEAITDPLTRREPLESVLRIFEDHIGEIGGGTAEAPREGAMFDTTALPAGWEVTVDRASDRGHGGEETFNGSRTAAYYPTSVQYEINGLGDTFATAQNLSLNDPLWSLADNQDIGDQDRNTSRTIPHTTVNGTTPDEVVDIYQFEVTEDFAQVILDIDYGANFFDFGNNRNSVDLKLQLFDATFNQLAIRTDSQVSDGASGSSPNSGNGGPGGPGGPGRSVSDDPYYETRLAAGTYYVAISPEATTFDAATGTFALDADARPTSGTYTLQVSVEAHPSDGGDPTNQSLHFDRSEPSGTLESAPFDLAGYGAEDLPRFYFNYFYDPAGNDNVTIRARSNENPTGMELPDTELTPSNQTNSNWNQAVSSLASFAGDTGIVVEITYTTDTTSIETAEGLYLDDFIVGFAERGELITGAPLGDVDITGFSQASGGQYQLEIREGATYANASNGGLILENTFDTNQRQSVSTTIVAPYADQIADKDTFVLSDGTKSVTYEFDLDTSSGITAGNIRIPYSATSTRSEIADAIVSVINSPVSQGRINVQATDSTGSATGGNGDVTIALAGRVFGDFLELDSPSELPPSGTPLGGAGASFQLPVVRNNGIGDSNVSRAQSQVIIENNVIRDVRAIGVFSESAPRDVDPRDPINNYLDQAPIGNAYPGAVRNFLTANDDVIGGQTPGIVVRNNIIDQAGFAGVKVEGDLRPLVIESDLYGLESLAFGDSISDGLVMIIDAADTRVVFEFEDIGGAAANLGGSGTGGGNGFTDGHVPIYYRRSDATPYNGRTTAHTRHEVMLAIYDAINSSILVSNGLVPLVDVTLGSSLLGNDPFFDGGGGPIGNLVTPNASVYIEGATDINFSFSFTGAGPSQNPFGASGFAPIHESAQPISRIINNTIYGADGTQAQFTGSARTESNDLLQNAIETQVGIAHNGPYIASDTSSGIIGDSVGLVTGSADVDMYRVQLGLGERLVVDVDTVEGGPDTVLRLFDSNGIEVAFNDVGTVADHLETGMGGETTDTVNTRDPSLDYTALSEGTYYVAVSSAGNQTYSARSLSDRVNGTGGEGNYDIAIEAYASRSFVLAIDSGSGTIDASALTGTTFTITQIPDLAGGTNSQTFEFNGGGNGNINIPLVGGDVYRVGDISRAISAVINRSASPLPNHASNNGPLGVSGPIAPVSAQAIGGIEGYNGGLRLFNTIADHNTTFGHNRSGAGNGVSEQYVLIERAAEITISPEAAAAGLHLAPADGSNIDQVLPETGILLTGGSSGTVLNNVLSNLHQGVVNEITYSGAHPKPGETIVVSNTFQNIALGTGVLRPLINSPIGGLTITPGPSNVNGGTDDFNETLGGNDVLFVNPAGDNFLPAPNAHIIDTAVNSITDREGFIEVKNSIGIDANNVIAPSRDVYGVFRADNPLYAPPHTVGETIFKDRGAVELADFVGPVAILNVPRDNDAEVIDVDGTTTYVKFENEIYKEFRIQLRDNGDESDPYLGHGVDDSTIVAPNGPSLRLNGSNVTVFENEQLLEEGIDYSFDYDVTKSTIILTPLAGIWKNDRAYRIAVNGIDRSVLVAPNAQQVSDGDQISITDVGGGNIVFEFETGYQLLVPDTIALTVPVNGSNLGGVRDGDLFQIDDGTNPIVVFEFNRPGDTKLANTVEVLLPAGLTPEEPVALQAYRETIAQNIQTAIQSQVDAGTLDVEVSLDGVTVQIGAEPGAVVDTRGNGLVQNARTVALQLPALGAGVGGVVDGDTFTIFDGTETVTFEFDDAGVLNDLNNIAIPIADNLPVADLAIAIETAIRDAMRLTPTVYDNVVYLDLDINGTASASPGQLSVVSFSRTPTDGDLISITPNDGSAPVILELNRTDEPNAILGTTFDDGVDMGHIPVNITRMTSGEELGQMIADLLKAPNLIIAGLEQSAITVLDGGQVSLGGEAGLLIETTGTELELVGQPDVEGSSSIEVFGSLLLQLPPSGGAGFTGGSVLILKDPLGNDVIFEFVVTNTLQQVPGAIPVTFNTFDPVNLIADALVAAINGSTAEITATVQLGSSGRISLGRITDDRVITTGIENDPLDPTDDVSGVPITTRRGIVTDGEQLTIRQGDVEVTYEFNSILGGGGVEVGHIEIPFQSSSTAVEIATSLAAAINNNPGSLVFASDPGTLPATVVGNIVDIADVPGTIVDASLAPTLNVTGTPGGAQPIFISPTSSTEDLKRAFIQAINREEVAQFTDLIATDRGGSTFFVENALGFEGDIDSFFLTGIKDVDGNSLEPNRPDQTTQFTILMPGIGMDFGDAADPVGGVPGRYPTTLDNNGPRHVVSDSIMLGSSVDIDANGQPSNQADGDNLGLVVTTDSDLFVLTTVNGETTISLDPTVSLANRDGDTITVSTGYATATLEFDLDGQFNEDHYEIKASESSTPEQIAQAIADAIAESPVNPASVDVVGSTTVVSGNDEEGVSFVSDINPQGILNKGVGTIIDGKLMLPITVTVTGGGFVDGWIDFGADGDFTDPGDQIMFSERFDAGMDGAAVTRTIYVNYPDYPWNLNEEATTFARFRVSREGGLSSVGMALSGEVEDYALRLLPGVPPIVSEAQANRVFSTPEDSPLIVQDEDGTFTQGTSDDDGLLVGIVDPNTGDIPVILASDVGVRTLMSGSEIAGSLNLKSDGTFSFNPAPDFYGTTSFTANVTDGTLISSRTITVTINVLPVNDAPFATTTDVVTNVTIDEDTVTTFDRAQLITPYYSAGPANEVAAAQPLAFTSVGFNNVPFTSENGGTIAIVDGGTRLVYTPPKDFNSALGDKFTYFVADVPGTGQTAATAANPGTVSISFDAVNDPPRLVNDYYDADEDTELTIAVRNAAETGILDNDAAGPTDEVAAGQTISLVTTDFPLTTFRRGTVRIANGNLIYSPPAQFSGIDQFQYKVRDNLGLESTATVVINVGGENDPPFFVGVNGVQGETSLSIDEGKAGGKTVNYDLSTWFEDPENDAVSYAVAYENTSAKMAISDAKVVGDVLSITMPAYGFGTATLTITATDSTGLPTIQPIDVTVNDTPDAPTKIGTLDPLVTPEDVNVVRDLTTIFFDPDGTPLEYSVTRIGNQFNPTAAQIAASSVVESVTFDGNNMTIAVKPNQFGSIEMEIAANDGSPAISDSFTFTVTSQPDAPVAVDDNYGVSEGFDVSVGSILSIQNPTSGLLQNDFDADFEAIQVDVNSISPADPNFVVSADGTFTYKAIDGSIGQTKSYTYSVLDSTGRRSNTATVSFTLSQSRYQNPNKDLVTDVTADGNISPIDALRIINLLSSPIMNGRSTLPVSEIGDPPPDFVDVSGDGFVTAFDALIVINTLNARSTTPQRATGEQVTGEQVTGEQVTTTANAAASLSYAAMSEVNLPVRNAMAVSPDPESPETLIAAGPTTIDSRDAVLQAGFEIGNASLETVVDSFESASVDEIDSESKASEVDEALTSLFDEASSNGLF
ncbi:tandem-95 repeat protein [Novipirellula aureliae]|uniref:tandem-95 repeat protein n=1 Tax=Novipirellula aureliae TaxID=2527966 RepID=UPI0018CFB697|nr:tandem-95 repeat protein [Novipirellula aureliae]